MRSQFIASTLLIALFGSAQAETVDVTRVTERHYMLAALGPELSGQCSRDLYSAGVKKVYEVTYVIDGKIQTQLLSYHPGRTVEIDARGVALSLPYDNLR